MRLTKTEKRLMLRAVNAEINSYIYLAGTKGMIHDYIEDLKKLKKKLEKDIYGDYQEDRNLLPF